MQVLSISTPISVPSIKYSLQCVLIASAREADGASVVTGYERGVDMASYECSLSDVDIIAADFSGLLSHRNLLHHPDRSLHFFCAGAAREAGWRRFAEIRFYRRPDRGPWLFARRCRDWPLQCANIRTSDVSVG